MKNLQMKKTNKREKTIRENKKRNREKRAKLEKKDCNNDAMLWQGSNFFKNLTLGEIIDFNFS